MSSAAFVILLSCKTRNCQEFLALTRPWSNESMNRCCNTLQIIILKIYVCLQNIQIVCFNQLMKHFIELIKEYFLLVRYFILNCFEMIRDYSMFS